MENSFKDKRRFQYDVVDTFLVYLVLALHIFQPFSSVSIVDFDQVITGLIVIRARSYNSNNSYYNFMVTAHMVFSC